MHPLAVAFAEDGRSLIVADALNRSIKRLDLDARTIEPVLGPECGLLRPQALAMGDGELFVVDSDADVVLRVDLQMRRAVPLEIVDPHPEHPQDGEHQGQPLGCRARTTVTLCFPLPEPAGSLPHPDAAPRAWLRNAEGHVLVDDLDRTVERQGEWGMVREVETAEPGRGTIEILASWLTCEDLDGVCHRQERYGRFELDATMDGLDVVDLPFES